MTSRNLTNLGLLILVSGLALYIFFSKPEQDATPPNLLSDIDTSDITTIEISRADQKPVRLSKQNNNWFITQPISIRANEVQVFALLALVNTISYGQYPVAQQNLAKYGLHTPTYTLKLNQNVFSFGQHDPINRNRYVLHNSSIHLIRDNYSSIAKSAPNGLIDLAILPQDNKIRLLRLPRMSLEMIAGNWQVTPAPVNPVSQDTIHKLIDEWQFAQALDVTLVNEDMLIAHNQQPIHIEFSNGSPALDLLFYVSENERLIVRPDLKIQYHLAIDSSNTLFELNETTQ